jgi:hypothetical protein
VVLAEWLDMVRHVMKNNLTEIRLELATAL